MWSVIRKRYYHRQAGKALKKVATEARRDLGGFSGKRYSLETFVKVDKDWRSSDKELRNFVISWLRVIHTTVTVAKTKV